MGLGKTIQAIAIAVYYKADWPLLIICPSSLRLNWSNEFAKWVPEIGYWDIKIIMKGKDIPNSLVNIVSYDLAHKMKLEQRSFGVIIADESHYLKNPDTIRAKTIVPILQKAKHAILLTGTPALSRPIELFSQLQALGCPIFNSAKAFGQRYCDAHVVWYVILL